MLTKKRFEQDVEFVAQYTILTETLNAHFFCQLLISYIIYLAIFHNIVNLKPIIIFLRDKPSQSTRTIGLILLTIRKVILCFVDHKLHKLEFRILSLVKATGS